MKRSDVEDRLERGMSYAELRAGDLFVFTGHKGSCTDVYEALDAIDFDGCRLSRNTERPNEPHGGFYATAQVRRVRDPGPEWKCVTCKHVGRDFRTVRYDTIDGTEFDMECPKCESTEVEETCSSSFSKS